MAIENSLQPNPHADAERIVNEAHYLERMERHGVPEHLREGLMLYLVHHIQPGHFLVAVLQNDLEGAFGRGDENSIAGLPAIMRFLVNDAPGVSYGGPTSVRCWLEAR